MHICRAKVPNERPIMGSDPYTLGNPRGRGTSLKNHLASLKEHIENEESARRKEVRGGVGFILRKPSGSQWHLKREPGGIWFRVDSWLKQNKPNHNPRTQDTEPICDSRWSRRPCDGGHTLYPVGRQSETHFVTWFIL